MDLNRAKALAIELMEKHNLFDKGWYFEFDNAKRRFGVCNYRKRWIGLSKHLVLANDERHVRNIILHEIAHALTPSHGHDWVWRAKAIEIGCDGNRCYNSQEVTSIVGKYHAVCPKCNYTHYCHRQRKRKTSCGVCNKTRIFDPNAILNFVPVK